MIRAYDQGRDAQALRDCYIELQESERRFELGMPAGEAIVDAYLERVFERGRQWDGQVFVAEVDGRVAGFVAVWARAVSDEPDDDPTPFGYISDLVVLPAYRRRRLGRALLEHAEHFARERGARCVRLTVLASNAEARTLYRTGGYRERELELEKLLAPR